MQSKLVLISGTEDSTKLAEDIYKELRDTYQMGDSINLFIPKKPSEVDRSLAKNRTYPHVVGMFNDGETRCDIGKNVLLDNIRGKHVAIVKYMVTPKREPDMHINDHLIEVVSSLDNISKVDTLGKTLVAPYLPYLRSHSIEKYEKRGFYQFNSLEFMVKMFSMYGLKGIICIDPHSEKIVEKAKEFGINVNSVDPFHSNKYTNPSKLGLNSTAEDVLSRLQPFLERFRKIKEDSEYKDNKFIFLSLDDNAEKRVERFVRNSGLGWDNILYIKKSRDTLGEPTFQIKSFSEIKNNDKIEDAMCIGLDDMIDSGGTCDGGMGYLKSMGDIKSSELWCTHSLAPDRKEIMKLKHIDKIVALDTILHDNPEELKIEYLNASSHLLSAEIFKAHMRLEEERLNV